jgi:putative membrane protein
MRNDRLYILAIIFISIAVPVIVGSLFFGQESLINIGIEVSFLPTVNACLNSLTTLCLLGGFYFIKRKNVKVHRYFMLSALGLSALFLVSYLIYHASAEPTTYGGEGLLQYIYYFILATHIILAAIILPLVLLTVYRGLAYQVEKHRKIARWTWPLWLYVAVTGVMVYLFLLPYY